MFVNTGSHEVGKSYTPTTLATLTTLTTLTTLATLTTLTYFCRATACAAWRLHKLLHDNYKFLRGAAGAEDARQTKQGSA